MRGPGLRARLVVLVVVAGAPAMLLVVVLLQRQDQDPVWGWAAAAAAAVWLVGGGVLLHNAAARRLGTVSNLLVALREGDYSFRTRGGRRGDALGELILELNALATELQDQRAVDLEATGLLRKVLAEIDAAVFSFDGGRRLRMVNEAGERVLAARGDELVGRDARDLGLEDCLDGPPARTLALSLPGGEARWELRRGGFRQHGRPHVLVVLSDVSRALRAEELGAWRRLIRVIGHELNNSLAPIKSVASSLLGLLERHAPDSEWREDARRGLEVISSRADGLNRFMTSYSALARLPPPSPGPVTVPTWVRRVARLETRVPVVVDEGPDLTLSADGDQLDQLLINLVRNAADASLEGGRDVTIRWMLCDGWVVVEVLDNGPGLPDSANVFVPFFTTKQSGSGIGLVLCRQIAESHGGSVGLEDREDGTGCRASIRLPVSEP